MKPGCWRGISMVMIPLRHAVLMLLACACAQAQLKNLKPGWNVFSPQQDIQLGHEAAQQVETKMPVVQNREVEAYLNTLLNRLKASPHAGNFPYAIHAIESKSVNAFSLPGGPIFINTATILTADNEAQLAGVIAHEMSHVYLRHATNQISKRNLISIPAMLVGHGLLGALAQVGAGLGALHFSRADEAQADYNGAEIMAEAGYNPVEMADFFEKLQAKAGREGVLSQMLSDHPNPGNRVAAVQDEVRQMPQRSFTANTGQFSRIQDIVRHLPPPGRLLGEYQDGHKPGPPTSRPSAQMREYRGHAFTLSYPENWQVFGDSQSNMVTIAPPEGVVGQGNQAAIGYGLEASYYFPEGDRIDLQRDTEALVRQLMQGNSGMRITNNSRDIQIAGQRGTVTVLSSQSPFQGETEVDTVIAVPRPEGLFYMALIAPRSESDQISSVFQQIINSVHFTTE